MRAIADQPPALDYIESSLARAYQRQLEQEERFFHGMPGLLACAILQSAFLALLAAHLPVALQPAGIAALIFFAAACLCALASLGFLAAALYPRSIAYVAREPAWLAYAQTLMQRERDHARAETEDSLSAIVTLKMSRANQYANAAEHNRQNSHKRDRARAMALLLLATGAATTILSAALALLIRGLAA